jgi:acetamidase/formamidase
MDASDGSVTTDAGPASEGDVDHRLEFSTRTTVVGVFDRAHQPALTVASGDTVEFQTGNLCGDAVTPETSFDELLDLLAALPAHAGAHTITGPIEVTGAAPGQVLKVDLLTLKPRTHGYNFQLPGHHGRGLLPEDFPQGRIRHYRHDLERMTVELSPGVVVPLRPFLGIVAVAPAAPGPHHSGPPGLHGGNLDVPAMGVGASAYLPVNVPGALFYAGDAHSVQGHGEVGLSAIETAMRKAEVRLSLLDCPTRRRPWVETPDSWITLGVHEDLLTASKAAIRDMITLLGEEHAVGPADAYTICSAAADLAIGQIVNGTKTVQATISKSIFA